MKRVVALSAVMAALVLVALSCDNPIVVERGLTLAWITAPPVSLREGDSAAVTVELRDGQGRAATDLDGATVDLRFVFQGGDSLPATACGTACTTTVAQGRASLTVQWVSAGAWAVTACVKPPAENEDLCAQHGLEVLAVHAALVEYPADSVGRRVRFPVEARLRLPNGTAVTEQARTVRLRFTSPLPEPAGGRVRCPEAGPMCERSTISGVVRLDSAMVVDTGSTTVTACVLTANGRERCDPAGGRRFAVVIPRVALRFVTGPSGGVAGVPFETQPEIEAVEPDGTRRADFSEIVTVTLQDEALYGPVLAGTDHDGGTARGSVTAQAVAGAAAFTRLRINRSGDGYTLVASAAGAIPGTFAAFPVSLDGSKLLLQGHVGDEQQAAVNTAVPIDPTVLVTGPEGDPIAAIEVHFNIFNVTGGSVAHEQTMTDAAGLASSGEWILGENEDLGEPIYLNRLYAGAEGVRVLHPASEGENLIKFVAYAYTAEDLSLAFLTQPVDTVAGATIQPVVVEIRAGWGERFFGATNEVFLSVFRHVDGVDPNGPFPVLGTRRPAVNGRATFDSLVITDAGRYVLYAALDEEAAFIHDFGVESVPFRARCATNGTFLVDATGSNQSATVGTAVEAAPGVRVVDACGIRSPGRTVTFAATLGGGTLTDPAQVTDPDGVARVGKWTLGPTPGVNMMTATTEGAVEPATFIAYGLAPTFDASVVSAGWDFTCATALTTSLPYCWGDNAYSQLGEGTQTARSRPTQLAGGLLQLTQVTGGFRFACGLATTGAAYCWGNNFYGQLGIDTFDVVQHATPEPVAGGHTFQQISAGFGHACALDTDGAVWCWGATSEGSLGGGTGTPFQPKHIASLLHFTQVDVGGNTSCALAESGDIWCWGNNDNGHLGNNSTDGRSYVPVQVVGGRSYTQVSVGTAHSCGISAGSVYCWGRNVEAQLGIGFASPTSAPGSAVPVAATGALGVTRQVTAGNKHTCAVNGIGEAYCWGDNTNGQLGDLTTTMRTSGVQVRTSAQFVAITAGLLHTCALRASGAAYCWGSNGSGRLGIGTSVASDYKAPVPVVVP